MSPSTRRLKVLGNKGDGDLDNDEEDLNQTAEEKREVTNSIQDISNRLREYKAKGDISELLNDDGFKELVRESREVIKNVKSTQEYLADSMNFKLLCSLLSEASAGIDGNDHKFSTQEYIANLGNHMKIQATDGDRYKLTSDAIVKFGKSCSAAFNYAPTCQFVLGTLNNEAVGGPARKRVVKRPASQKAKEKGATKIANIGKSQTVEALTDKYVKITKKALEDNYACHKRKPLCYFSFVIDPDSFCKTVENMFHVSFLVKQRVATLAIGGNGMPTIEPYSGEDSDSDEEGEGTGYGMDQAVIDICQADWIELKTNLKITKKMIDTS